MLSSKYVILNQTTIDLYWLVPKINHYLKFLQVYSFIITKKGSISQVISEFELLVYIMQNT
jgi:hypothetical protein